MTFQEKVRSMSAKEIIMAMVEGLRNPKCEINMLTFGDVYEKEEGKFICYGCAATNTIMQISGVVLTKDNISDVDDRANAINSDYYFLDMFESAIDSLRCGHITSYNSMAEDCGIAKLISTSYLLLPFLVDNYTEEQLQEYVDFANLHP